MLSLLLLVGTFQLDTVATRTDYVETGRLDEVDAVCAAVGNGVGRRCLTIGTSPEGRAIKAILVGVDSTKPTVLVIGGIHAGEIDGKDASFAFIDALMNGRVPRDVVNFAFVPVYNVDGHERRGKNHRPNQRGPEETGWRVTSSNLNLNRDWVKADAPETRALLEFMRAIDPVVTIDLHATDGAQFQHDIAVIVEPSADDGSSAGLLAAGRALSTSLQASLQKSGHLPLDFYPQFEIDDDPSSGITVGVTPARFTHGYLAKRGRIGVLVETHSWRPYRERVQAMIDLLHAVAQTAKTQAPSWTQAARAADAEAVGLPGKEITLTYDLDTSAAAADVFAFRGYAYTRTPSTISGAQWTRYDETKKQTWRIPVWRTLKPKLVVKAPAAYAVLPGYAADVVTRLQAHGIEHVVLDAPTALAADSAAMFKAASVTFSPRPIEGRMTATPTGQWTPLTKTTTTLTDLKLPKGTVLVPVAQPRGRLVLELFEPGARDALVGQGFFNACFEQKEYMESYVVEVEARAMLAKDPALAQRFEERLRNDAAFAADSDARLDFFYRQHPAWDARKDVVPVVRLSSLPSPSSSSSSSR